MKLDGDEAPTKQSHLKRFIPFWSASMIAGGVAGTCAKTAVAPLERVKILFQIRSVHYPWTGFFSTATTIKKIINNEGVLGLWKGNTATIVRIFPYAAIQFYSYETSKKLLHNALPAKTDPNMVNLMAGGIAGAVSVIFTYPLDLVRVRLAVAVNKSDKRLGFGIVGCIRDIVVHEGIRGLYKGMWPTLLGIVPYAGVNFASFEFLKEKTSKYLYKREGELPVPLKLLCGGFAGAIGQTVAYPLDVVRRQMQTSGWKEGHGLVHTSTMSALRTIIQREGVYGLFRGLSINYIRVGPSVAISFTVYDVVKKHLT